MTQSVYLRIAQTTQLRAIEGNSCQQEELTPRINQVASQHINRDLEQRLDDFQEYLQNYYASMEARLARLEQQDRVRPEEISLWARVLAMFRMYIEAFKNRVSQFINR